MVPLQDNFDNFQWILDVQQCFSFSGKNSFGNKMKQKIVRQSSVVTTEPAITHSHCAELD